MEKVALYLRKSREDEETKEETLERHSKMLLDYCKRNSLIIIDTYKEVVSGESIANRPEMQRLLNKVDSGAYNGVVCVELERLSRGNPVDQCDILDRFKKSNTKIYTLQKTYDLGKEEIDEEFFEFSLFMSRREYKVIRRRMDRGRKQADKEGYYTGSVTPYGYDKEKGERGFILVPNPAEAEVVKLIYDKYINGTGIAGICKYLATEGIFTRAGKPFAVTTLRSILKNENYIGMINIKKRDGQYKGKHEPILSEDIFYKAQELLKVTEPKVKAKKELKNPLASLLKCGLCGRVMSRSSNGSGTHTFKCNNPICNNRGIKCETIEDIVLNKLKTELKDIKYYMDNYECEIKTKKTKQQEEILTLEKELDKQRKALDTICEMLEEGIYTKEMFLKRSEAVENKIKDISDKLTQLKNTDIAGEEKALKSIPILEKIIDKYDTLSPKDKNILLKKIIKSIEFTRIDKDSEVTINLLIK